MNKKNAAPSHALSQPLILLMAAATGLAVASNYYAQPLLAGIADAFALSTGEAGIIVLDLAVQAIHVTNQTMIYRMMPEARSRLTAGYMTSYFLGGALGSVLSASAYQKVQWSGVALVGVALSALNLLVWHLGKVDAKVDTAPAS